MLSEVSSADFSPSFMAPARALSATYVFENAFFKKVTDFQIAREHFPPVSRLSRR